MISNIRTGRLIKKAMALYHIERMREFDSYLKNDVEFSQEFEERMERLVEAHTKKQAVVIKRRRFAKIAIAMMLAFLMLTAFAARDEVAQYFIKIFEDHSFMSSTTEGPRSIEVKYTPRYFSDGYTLTFEEGNDNVRYLAWEQEGQNYKFSQTCVSNNAYIDSSSYTKKTVDGMKIYCFETKHNRALVAWHMDGYDFKIDYPSDSDWNTVVEMIRSVQSEN